jgi:hypothetical protein
MFKHRRLFNDAWIRNSAPFFARTGGAGQEAVMDRFSGRTYSSARSGNELAIASPLCTAKIYRGLN